MSKRFRRSLLQTQYCGRHTDYAGVGLQLLLTEHFVAPSCLYNCATGRPFRYRATDHSDEWLNPYLSFVKGIRHAVNMLELTDTTQLWTKRMLDLSPVEYSHHIEQGLSNGPVLLGPFSASLLEKEFSNRYRVEANHCLLCVSSNYDQFLLLHPDGLLFDLSSEQLLELHRNSFSDVALILTLHGKPAPGSVDELMTRVLIGGARVAQGETVAKGPADFLFCIQASLQRERITTKMELQLRLGLSQMSINLEQILELLTSLSNYQSLSTLTGSILFNIYEPLIDVITTCASLSVAPIEHWCKNNEGFNYLARKWVRFEEALSLFAATEGAFP